MRLPPAAYTLARWISSADRKELERFIDRHRDRIADDAAGVPAYLATNKYDLGATQERWPLIEFHTRREHTGLAQTEALA
jgi:peptide chain release factor 3